MTQAYALTWPPGWPRTPNRAKSLFKTTLPGAINNVQTSLKQFASDSGKGISDMMVSSNVTLMDNNPKDPGVAVYFTWDGISTCIAVDRYLTLAENLQAIHHVIEAERTKLRHGGLNLVRAAFRGYAALPPPSGSSQRAWRDVLNAGPSIKSKEVIDKLYRDAAAKAHPDKAGGSHDKMSELNAARADAYREIGR